LFPFRALLDSLRTADLLFGNLESPIAPPKHLIEDTGSHVFTAPAVAANALARAGFKVVSTANNHAWDAGVDGVLETLRQLDRAKVAHAGTGRTREEAERPTIVRVRGWKVAVFAATRAFNPAPYAFERHPGAQHVAWADTAWLYPAIRRVKATHAADLVIVSIHGGVELASTPSSWQRDLFHGAVDAGADIVLGHHSHVLQPIEWYHSRPIAYSLGNFVFWQGSPWSGLSAIFRFTVRPDRSITLDLSPVRAGYQVRPVRGPAADSVHRRVGIPSQPPITFLPRFP
jgi:poly-gamma-glutamate synthesis protein (capsule biosynthesis protein)